MAAKKSPKPVPIPESFATPQEAGAFWDRHDLADYWDQTTPVGDLHVQIQERQYLLAVEPALAQQLTAAARQRGISAEALANLWLSNQLVGPTP